MCMWCTHTCTHTHTHTHTHTQLQPSHPTVLLHPLVHLEHVSSPALMMLPVLDHRSAAPMGVAEHVWLQLQQLAQVPMDGPTDQEIPSQLLMAATLGRLRFTPWHTYQGTDILDLSLSLSLSLSFSLPLSSLSTCTSSGAALCTLRACPQTCVDSAGNRHAIGQNFTAPDGCNTWWVSPSEIYTCSSIKIHTHCAYLSPYSVCGPGGLIACTEIYCRKHITLTLHITNIYCDPTFTMYNMQPHQTVQPDYPPPVCRVMMGVTFVPVIRYVVQAVVSHQSPSAWTLMELNIKWTRHSWQLMAATHGKLFQNCDTVS